jgi:hypothetical protein
MELANWMLHLRDGGERVGLHGMTWKVNAEADVYDFYNSKGEIEYSIPFMAVKYIQRKHSNESR